MTATTTIFATAALLVLSAASLSAAQAGDSSLIMKPLQGVSFHAGTTYAAGYFLSENRSCKLVLTVADEANYDPKRFEAVIEPGKSTRYQLAHGKSLDFDCLADARELSVVSVQATAGN